MGSRRSIYANGDLHSSLVTVKKKIGSAIPFFAIERSVLPKSYSGAHIYTTTISAVQECKGSVPRISLIAFLLTEFKRKTKRQLSDGGGWVTAFYLVDFSLCLG